MSASPAKQNYAEAYREMREGVLYLFIAWILLGIGITYVFTLAIGSSVAGFHRMGTEHFGLGMLALVSLAIFMLIGAVIALVGLWGKFIPGVKKLASVNPEFSTSSTFVNLGLFWGTVLMLIGALTVMIVVGAFIMIIGFILFILGYIGMLLLCFKLNDLEKNSLYLAAGILFIIGIILPILDFVAWILLYVALGDSLRKASSQATQIPPSTPSPQPSA
ncbi:MAG: DUF973 family protein [Desulfurococcales archaeon]|jgi:uncharacterized membrane protein|nr:DUF973 family protein [Desulfurococcales archaeon]